MQWDIPNSALPSIHVRRPQFRHLRLQIPPSRLHCLIMPRQSTTQFWATKAQNCNPPYATLCQIHRVFFSRNWIKPLPDYYISNCHPTMHVEVIQIVIVFLPVIAFYKCQPDIPDNVSLMMTCDLEYVVSSDNTVNGHLDIFQTRWWWRWDFRTAGMKRIARKFLCKLARIIRIISHG